MKKERENMVRVMDDIRKINISTNIQKQIGLEADWKNRISPKKVERIMNTASRFQKALKELSKN